MICDFTTTAEGSKYRHHCRRCGATALSRSSKLTRKCHGIDRPTQSVPGILDPIPEIAALRICHDCSERPAGCWKAQEYDCQRKYREAASRAARLRLCPIGKLGCGCSACGYPDPLPEPELRPVPAGWATSAEQRQRHVDAFRRLQQAPVPACGAKTGQGVLWVGEGKYWPGIVIGVRLLRQFSDIPVEIWSRGPVGHELDDVEGVRLVDMLTMQADHPARILRGWEAKAYAIAHSRFEQILFLDADAYCTADPLPLFDHLRQAPFVYWEDLHCCKANVRPEGFGITQRDIDRVPPVQGGQLLIDVPRFWREILLTHWLCQHSDYSFKYGFGDQDQWRAVLAATGQRFTCLGPARWQRVAFNCAGAIVHRCRSKLFVGSQPARWERLPQEAEVFRLFTELSPSYRQPSDLDLACDRREPAALRAARMIGAR